MSLRAYDLSKLEEVDCELRPVCAIQSDTVSEKQDKAKTAKIFLVKCYPLPLMTHSNYLFLNFILKLVYKWLYFIIVPHPIPLDRDLLFSPGCPGNHFEDEAVLEVTRLLPPQYWSSDILHPTWLFLWLFKIVLFHSLSSILYIVPSYTSVLLGFMTCVFSSPHPPHYLFNFQFYVLYRIPTHICTYIHIQYIKQINIRYLN